MGSAAIPKMQTESFYRTLEVIIVSHKKNAGASEQTAAWRLRMSMNRNRPSFTERFRHKPKKDVKDVVSIPSCYLTENVKAQRGM